MRKLLYIALLMVLAGTVSCHRTSEAEARLIAIDSLIPVNPDSALTLLEAIEPRAAAPKGADAGGSPDTRKSHADAADYRDRLPASRMTRSERAYHALLTVQALYKAYIPATSDSLINIAWDYYKDHGPYDRRIRAMLYKGTTAEELGHPDSAMRWYKRTELESRPDDHYHRGYALMKIAESYLNAYDTNNSIKNYKNALSEFTVVKDTINTLFCGLRICQIHSEFSLDSCSYYSNFVRNLARKSNYNQYIAGCTRILGTYQFYEDNYLEAKDSMLFVLDNLEDKLYSDYAILAISYISLNIPDSADYFFEQAGRPTTTKDSILYYQFLSIQSKFHGDIDKSIRYEQISNNLASDEMLVKNDGILQQIEFEETESHQNRINKKRFFSIISIILSFSLLCLTFNYFMNLKRRKRFFHEINELQAFSDRLQHLNDDLKNKYDEYSSQNLTLESPENQTIPHGTLPNRIDSVKFNAIISGLSDSYRFILTQLRQSINNEKELEKLDKTIKESLTPKYFEHLRTFVDYAYSGLATSMVMSGTLKDKEINLLCMYLCRIPNTIMRIYTGLSNTPNMIRSRNNIAKKYFGSKEVLDQLLEDMQF